MSIHSFRVKERNPDTGEATVYAVGLVGDDPLAAGFYEMGTVSTVEEAIAMTSQLNGGNAASGPGPTKSQHR